MFDRLTLRGVTFAPARFCAPLAGITHSAFRGLAAEFGGCGGFFTEMLSAKHVLHEDLRRSPWHRRSPLEPRLIHQLMVRDSDPLDRVIERLATIPPDGIDLNLACHAPNIRSLDAGSRLFEDLPALRRVLATARRAWPGLLTVKLRLGHAGPAAAERFAERLRAIEDAGVDAVILHPRYFEDRFKRRARHELYAWVASLTRLPIVANGDITGPATLAANAAAFAPCAAIMVGRMAAVRPWVFAAWDRPVTVDYAAVWRRLVDGIVADFPPRQALARVKIVTEYYARNFHFGHTLYVAVQNAPTLEEARARAEAFYAAAPAVFAEPSLQGL